MAEENNSKNFSKLTKLEKQIKSGQEKLKNAVKKLAPPKKKVKRGYANFPSRDDEGRLIRLPVRKRKFEDADQYKEEGGVSVNVEPLVQHDGVSSTINAKVLKSVDELKIKIEQLKKCAAAPDNRTTWEKRKQREMENWANLRQCLFEAEVKTKFANSLNECSKCQNQTVCLIRCQQCAATLCNTCDESMHTVNALHDRQVKIRFHWADIAPLQSADIDDEGEVILSVAERYPPVFTRCDCGSANFDFTKRCRVVVITEKGRYDVLLPNIECMDCAKDISPKLEDLIKRGFWPGSPRIHDGMYLFSEDLLRLFDYLKLEKAGMSVKAFISALQFLSASHGRHNVISQKIFHEAFREWRKCKYEIRQLEKKDAMSCPACQNDLHACHIDGNRKLYRFKNMAISTEENYFKNVFIVDDLLVEDIVGKIQSSGIQEKSSYCGQTYWQAAKSRSKSFKNLEETGLVVGCCKHAVMLKALNMYQGEIYAYPLTLQWLISQDYSEMKFICQDVICKYFPWMMKVLDKPINIPGIETLRHCKPFLSVMHGKAHNWSCQIKWGGRWQAGSGSVTGEEMEQCNSYLSTAGLTTKNMSKTGREEEITMHVLHWNTKKRDRLPERLAINYVKTKKAMLDRRKELEDFCQENNVLEDHITSWEMSLREMANDTPRQKSADLTDAEKFFMFSVINKDSSNINSFVEEADPVCGLLTGSRELQKAASDFKRKENMEELDQLRARMCINDIADDDMFKEGKVSMAKKRVAELEKLIETSYSSIKYREIEVSKIADSSKVRHRIRKKLADEKKYIQELVAEYNLIASVVSSGFETLSEVDVHEGNWPWITVIGHDDIPTRVKRKTVEKKLELIRLGEEEALITEEMKSVLNYFQMRGEFLKQRRACLVRKLESSNYSLSDIHEDVGKEGRYNFTETPDYNVIGGYIALIERQYFLNEKRIEHCCDMFSNILESESVNNDVLDEEEEEEYMLDMDESELLENLDDFTFEEIDELNL